MKKVLTLMLASAVIAGMLACCISPVDAASKSPKLSRKQGTFVMGQSSTIKVKNRTSKSRVSFKSSKPSIASVTRKGKVTALSPGTATVKVTVKKGKKKKTLKYKVKVRRPGIKETVVNLNVGETDYLTLKNAPKKTAMADIYWSTDDGDIATVRNGAVRAVGPGTTTIRLTITTENATVSSAVEVNVAESPDPEPSKPEPSHPEPSTPEPDDVEVYENNDAFAKAGAELIKSASESGDESHILEGDFASRRLIVKGNSDLDISGLNAENAIFDGESIWILQFEAPHDARKAMQALAHDRLVEWVEADKAMELEASAAVQASSNSWGVSTIEADAYAEHLSSQTNATIVSVIDTGVADHPFLKGRILSGGFDFVDVDENPTDGHYHGTHVAGTIVDCTPDLPVYILPIRVLDQDGTGYNSNVAAGIRYAVDHGADVVNLSLEGGHSSYVDEAISYATDSGVAVVAAAGNENRSTAFGCPAHISSAIVVAALQENMKRADFSNYGDSVDIIAPGVKILSCVPGGEYRKLSGTSMAAPHISAVAAMLKLEDPERTPEQIEQILTDISMDLGDDGWDQFYGAGLPKLGRLIEVDPAEIRLNTGSDWQNLQVGQTLRLKATIQPAYANQSVTMESLSPSIIDVDAKGLITAKKQGRGRVMVQAANGLTTYCYCHVTDPRRTEQLVVPEITSLQTDPYLNVIQINFSEFSIPGDDGHVELRIRANGNESFIGNFFDQDELSYDLPYTRHGNLIRDGAVPDIGDTVQIGINTFSWTEGQGASRSAISWKSVRLEPPTRPVITSLTHDPAGETLSVKWNNHTECLNPLFSCIELWARTPDGDKVLIDDVYPDTTEYARHGYIIQYKNLSNLLAAGLDFRPGDTVEIGISYYYAGCGWGRSDIDWKSITLK